MSQFTAGRIREKHVPEHTALRCVDVAAERAGVKTYIWWHRNVRHGRLFYKLSGQNYTGGCDLNSRL